ncbi:MAG TPA: hypothetical protein V6D10_05895 [Trichocoleus sp.]|jgi:hypothetical protein
MTVTNCKTSTKSPAYQPTPKFEYVPEWDEFLELFPHRFDYLFAPHPDPGDRPDWQTESRHPLTDRLIMQGARLFGVRFGPTTNYLLLDIDRKSAYHPARDPQAIARIVEALEPLGLYKYVAITSSYSGGIHLYFPFPWKHPSWSVAQAVEILLERAGLKLNRGQLELFPNPKKDAQSLYNGHRLPLQAGSYLLNSEFEQTFTSRAEFVNRWRFAWMHNGFGADQIERTLSLQRKKYRTMGTSAQKFLNDLNAEIKTGWTGHGQTNNLIGRIALREYIFYHYTHGGDPLHGIPLIERIVDVATSLPGYEEWCRHQHEIYCCAEYWARCAELSEYYPYKGKEHAAALSEDQKTNWNLKQAEEAQARILAAVTDLKSQNALPEGIGARAKALEAYGISGSTLYKYKALWHPKTLEPAPDGLLHPVQEIEADPRSPEPAPDGLLHPVETISFYLGSEDAPPAQSSSHPFFEAVGGCGGLSTADGIAHLRSIVAAIQHRQSQPPAPDDPPPDERWFRSTNLWQQMAIDLEGEDDG